ncbi:MAG: acyltransferase family protein [Bacteroidaceae bacterium]|nr:acyltransferase family protein [Bacteroidaceae bacterium]
MNAIESKNKRIDFIDIAKAIGIITVIASHSVYASYTSFAYAYMIPIFFILTGYTYKYQNLSYKEECIKKFKRLIIPYFIFNLILVSYTYIIREIKGGQISLIDIFGFLYSRYTICDDIYLFTCYNGPTWFLTALLVSFYWFLIFIHYVKTLKKAVLLCISFFAITYLFEYSPLFLPWSIDSSFLFALFILAGHIMNKKNIPFNYFLFFITIFIYIIYYFLASNYTTNLSLGVYGKGIIYIFIGGIASSYCIIFLSKKIERTYFGNILKHIGKRSLTIFCLQMPLLGISKNIFNLFSSNIFGTFIFQLLFTVIIGYLIAILLHKLLPKFL